MRKIANSIENEDLDLAYYEAQDNANRTIQFIKEETKEIKPNNAPSNSKKKKKIIESKMPTTYEEEKLSTNSR